MLVTLADGLSAWSAFLAIHRYVPSHGAAACGGLVYGFSPAMVGHSHHPNLILIFLLLWQFVLLDEILDRQRRSPIWLGVGLGAVAAAQLLTGAEVFAGMVLLGLVLLVLLVAASRHELRDKGRYAATALAVSVVVFEVLVMLPLRAQIAGPARVHADLTEEVRGSSDLLALATPSRLLAIAPEAAVRLGDQFAGTRETYLGIPLLLVVAMGGGRVAAGAVAHGAGPPRPVHRPVRGAAAGGGAGGAVGRRRAAARPGRRRRRRVARLPGPVGAPHVRARGHAAVLHRRGGDHAPARRRRRAPPRSPSTGSSRAGALPT